MKNLFSLVVCIILACTELSAQVTVHSSIGLAVNYCTAVNPVPMCSPVPTAQDHLSYIPGEDGVILVTHTIINGGSTRIVDLSINDSDRGVVLNGFILNLLPGQTHTVNQVYPAETLPRLVNADVQFRLIDHTGMQTLPRDQYTLDVVAPEWDLTLHVDDATNVCSDETDIASCTPTPTTEKTMVTMAAGETMYIHVVVENTGLSEIEDIEITTLGSVIISNTTDVLAGSAIIYRTFITAPTMPGVHNVKATVSGQDLAGNPITEELDYTITVVGPQWDLTLHVDDATNVCSDESQIGSCDTPSGAKIEVTVAAGETLYMNVQVQNTGTSEIEGIKITALDNVVIENTTDIPENSGLTYQFLIVAPTEPKIHYETVLIEGHDPAGNMITAELDYTITVVGPQWDLTLHVDDATNVCSDETDIATCTPTPTTEKTEVTIAAGETMYIHVVVENTGLSEIEDIRISTTLDGVIISNTTDVLAGSAIIYRNFITAPTMPGEHNVKATVSGQDLAGNAITEELDYTITVVGPQWDLTLHVDEATNVCTDISDLNSCAGPSTEKTDLTIAAGETMYMHVLVENTGFSHISDIEFSALGSVIVSNTPGVSENSAIIFRAFVTAPSIPGVYNEIATVRGKDPAGNEIAADLPYTIMVDCPGTVAIQEGENSNCMDDDISVSNGASWQALDIGNKRVAAVRIGSNKIDAFRITVYKSNFMTQVGGGEHLLSKRIVLEPLFNGVKVQPDQGNVQVRLYYTDNELSALANVSGVTRGQFMVVKTDPVDCGDGYNPATGALMSTSGGTSGCLGDGYYEFSTDEFSTFYLFASEPLLPVELTSFEASLTPQNSVHLDWVTSSEINNDHYVIQRSRDGIVFDRIGTIAGSGTTYSPSHYDFLDAKPVDGINFYRLLQVDLDGSSNPSPIRQVEVEPRSVHVYPNPARHQITLRGHRDGNVAIFDFFGKQVLRHDVTGSSRIDLSQLTSGTYYLRIDGQIERLVKL